MTEISLRATIASDLTLFFEHQLDDTARYIAAFASPDPTNKNAFLDHWTKVLMNDAIIMRTILVEDTIAGHIEAFEFLEKQVIGYWTSKEFWGKGVTTNAVSLFLEEVTARPLYAHVVKDNIGSRRVLEKNGFKIIGEGKDFAYGRGVEVEEHILMLDVED